MIDDYQSGPIARYLRMVGQQRHEVETARLVEIEKLRGRDEYAATKAAPESSWNLTKPKRFHGYTRPLYELLREAHSSGKPKPTAHDVLAAFSKANHSEIANVILGAELNYYTAGGTTIKTANLKAIGEAIRKMTL